MFHPYVRGTVPHTLISTINGLIDNCIVLNYDDLPKIPFSDGGWSLQFTIGDVFYWCYVPLLK